MLANRVTRLTRIDQRRLEDWVLANIATIHAEKLTRGEIASRAQRVLEIEKITESHVAGTLGVLGLKTNTVFGNRGQKTMELRRDLDALAELVTSQAEQIEALSLALRFLSNSTGKALPQNVADRLPKPSASVAQVGSNGR